MAADMNSPKRAAVEQGPCISLACRKQDLAMTKQQPAAAWMQTLAVCEHNPQGPCAPLSMRGVLKTSWFQLLLRVGFIHPSCGCVTWPKGKNYPRRFKFWNVFLGGLPCFSRCVSLCYIVSWLWGSCRSKSTAILFYYGFCFPEMLQLMKFFSDNLGAWYDCDSQDQEEKGLAPYYTVKTWQLLPLDFVEPRFCPMNLRSASDCKSRSTWQEGWDSLLGALILDEMWVLQWMRVSLSMYSSFSFVGACSEKKSGGINRMS